MELGSSKSFLFSTMLCGLLFCAAGCSDKTDRTDPSAVARSFLMAAKDGDVNKAAKYVLEGERKEFIDYMTKAVDNKLQTKLQNVDSIEVTIEYRNSTVKSPDVMECEAKVEGSGVDIDMIKKDGKWWIVR